MGGVRLIVVAATLGVVGCAQIAGIEDWRGRPGPQAGAGAGAAGGGGAEIGGAAGSGGGGCKPETGRCWTEPCFPTPTTHSPAIVPLGLAVGPISSEAVADVVLAGAQPMNGSGQVEHLQNDGSGQVGSGNVLNTGVAQLQRVAIGALLANAPNDVLVLDADGNAHQLPADSQGILTVGAPTPAVAPPPAELRLARDGARTEDSVYVADFNQDLVKVLHADTNGLKADAQQPAFVFKSIMAMIARDLDGDGHVDLAISGVVDTAPALFVSLFASDGGGFAQVVEVAGSIGASELGAADIVGDDGIDLVELDPFDSHVLVHERVAGGWKHALTVDIGKGAQSMALGDFDGDGDLDVAVAEIGAPGIRVLLTSCARGLVPAFGSPYPGGAPLAAIATGRLDTDASDDIVGFEAVEPYRVQSLLTGR